MEEVVPGNVTQLLQRFDGGDREALGELLPLVYGELRAIAGRLLQPERSGHTLQSTALVHEAYIRMMGGKQPGWTHRRHFFRAAAMAMRCILVNHARDRKRQ